MGSCSASKPWRSSPSKQECVQYSILFSAHFLTVSCCTFNLISHVLNGSQAAGPDPPMALWTKCIGKQSPSPGRAPEEVASLAAYHPSSATSWPSRENIFNSRLSSLWQDGYYEHQVSPLSPGLHTKSFHLLPPTEKQDKWRQGFIDKG